MMTLSAEGCRQRRERLAGAVEADLIVINNPRHLQYLTGLYVTPLALSGWGANFLLIDCTSGKSTLLVHNSLAQAAENAHADAVEVWTWYDAAQNPGIEIFGSALRELNARLERIGPRRAGVEIGWMPLGARVENPVDVTGTLDAMQRQKYPDELALIREAVRVVEAGHRGARAAIAPGVTELDVYNAIQAAMVLELGDAVLLMNDLVSGERTYDGGGAATRRTLRAGELVIADLFPLVNGYRADFTATIAVDGHLTDIQRKLETALHAAIAAGEGMLKPGSGAGDVYRAMRAALDSYGFGEGFNHHGGHGLGLGHPQAPFFVPNSEETLLAGDVVTLEPGSYGAGYGARIEHNYLITETGFERLSNHRTTF